MSVFVDTNVYFAVQNERDSRHETGRTALETVLEGTYGKPYTSDYVVDEAVTLTLRRTGRHEQATTVANRIRGRSDFPDAYELLLVDRDSFERAVDLFGRYADQALSFTDAATVALVRDRGIDAVLSFDDDFDGIVGRIDPAEV